MAEFASDLERRVAEYSEKMNHQRSDFLSEMTGAESVDIYSYLRVDSPDLLELQATYPELYHRLIGTLSFRMSMKISTSLVEWSQEEETTRAALSEPRGSQRKEYFELLKNVTVSINPHDVDLLNNDEISEIRAKVLWFSKVTRASPEVIFQEIIGDALGLTYYARDMHPTELKFLGVVPKPKIWDLQLEYLRTIKDVNDESWVRQFVSTAIEEGADERFVKRQAQSFLNLINIPEGSNERLVQELREFPQDGRKFANAFQGELPKL